MNFVQSRAVERIRRSIDHPVIDSDAHLIEYYPVVRDFLVEEAGETVAGKLDAVMDGSRAIRALPHDQHRHYGAYRYSWWGIPSENTLDRATAISPNLMRARLDELGIDYAVLYPTGGLGAMNSEDEELRRAGTRAYNRYYREIFGGHRDRMEPVAMIPMVTPQEALEALEHAVNELGFKAVVLSGITLRPVPGAEGVPGAKWVDTLAHDSDYDYEPVWARCQALGVSPTFHHSGMGWGSRMSRKTYVYNHLGHFAAAGEAICRSLFLAGVPKRYPQLRFAFLEGGVAWALSLYASILGVWGKRSGRAIERLNPTRLDRTLLTRLLDEHGPEAIRERLDRLDEGLMLLADPEDPGPERDEFRESGVAGRDDIEEIFSERFFFGCEADDPMNALAFTKALNPTGTQLRAMFASDIGHWDVPDIREVLPEAWELVEDGVLDAAEFRAFTCDNVIALLTAANPDFFDGTVVDAVAGRSSRSSRSPSS
jgi:predicted TIM-barrel fold metal-dependent hydrolase